MGKKGLVTTIFSKLVETSPASSPGTGTGGGQASPPSWAWPSCRNNPQTTSFRVDDGDEDPCCTSSTTGPGAAGMTGKLQLHGAAAGEMYKTVNSVYFDSAVDDYFSLDGGEDEKEEKGEEVLDDESCFSTTTASEEWSEAVIRSLSRSTSTHRFFFDPGPPAINSILPATAASPPASNTTTPPAEPPPNKPATAASDPEPDLDDDGKKQQPCTSKSLAEGTVAVAVDSSDPFGDFLASMEEMVAAHGLRDWAALEELLSWYLRVNGKHNHPIIVGAFVDLVIGLASSTAATTTTTRATTSSSGGKSTKSSITSMTSATATTSTAMERCGGGANGASCSSSSSSSCATPDCQDVAEEKACGDPSSDDDHIRRGECEHRCRST